MVVTAQGGRKWAFLYRCHGKQKELGLGKAGKGGVSLAKARELADRAREHLAEGRDPIAVKSATRHKSAKSKTLGEVAVEKSTDRVVRKPSDDFWIWDNGMTKLQRTMHMGLSDGPRLDDASYGAGGWLGAALLVAILSVAIIYY